MREWWGEPETELGYVIDMIEGRDTTRPFIFCVDGEAAGYIQYWFIGHHQNASWIADYPWLAELPVDAVGVDLSIGDPARLSQGIGSAVLQRFARHLAGKGHRTIIIDPDPANRRAVRAYEKAGFRAIPKSPRPDRRHAHHAVRRKRDRETNNDQLLPPRDRLRARPLHRRPEGCQACGCHRAPQPLAAPAIGRRPQGGGAAQEHPDDRAHRLRQDGDFPPAGQARGRAVPEGGGHQVHRGRLRGPGRGLHRARSGGGGHRPDARDQAPRSKGAGREERRGAGDRRAGRRRIQTLDAGGIPQATAGQRAQ